MTNQGSKGAAKDLTADPDFMIIEANSPPQGIKRSGSTKTISTEKKNKSTPKEAPPPNQHFWLGFEMLEKLALEEGAPLVPIPTSVHNLIRAGFPKKEAKDFLKAVHSFPHVAQTCFPLCRNDGVA